MSENYINLDLSNLEKEHLCCAIADKKHQCGVGAKKEWLKERINEGHIFRKLDAKGKVFIEYSPLKQRGHLLLGEIIYIFTAYGFRVRSKGKVMQKH